MKYNVKESMLITQINLKIIILSPLAAETASKLDVLRQHSPRLSMYGAQLGVLKETHQVDLGRLLQHQKSRSRNARSASVQGRAKSLRSHLIWA